MLDLNGLILKVNDLYCMINGFFDKGFVDINMF